VISLRGGPTAAEPADDRDGHDDLRGNVGARGRPAVDITARIASALPDVKILAVEPHAPSLPGRLDACGMWG
jgi:hypothetical protein